jgi:SAM-dependent methyltransferase
MRSMPVEHKGRSDRRGSRKDRRTYPLGYSDGEFKRLEQQGAFLRDLTEDVLRRAGIAPGMRVLDIGCGVGDVSMLAGGLVGPSGEVLGIDRSPEAVAVARRRVAAVGQNWVRFAATAIETFSTIVTFDAIIGRLVLMFLPDPAAALQRLCVHVRSGGVVVFQESAVPLTRSIPDAPLFDQCIDRITDTFTRSGFEIDMGGKLFATFLAAGLTVQQMIVAGRVEGGPHSAVYDYITGAVRSLLPAMERLGVATSAEVDIDTLAERLRKEAVQCNACIMPPPLIGAWARTPA